MFLEIACFELKSAEIALNSVADRVEFCADGHLGGTTPNVEELKYLKSKYQQPIFVMIRPRGGDFCYTNEEFEQMKQSLQEFYNAGADGFVFGILHDNGEIDTEKCKELVALAKGKPCTFHRAFDHTPNLEKSVEILVELGFKTILTSGGTNSAMEGKNALKLLVEKYSESIDILIGGGVRSSNIKELKEATNGQFFHSSAIISSGEFASEEEIISLKNNLK